MDLNDGRSLNNGDKYWTIWPNADEFEDSESAAEYVASAPDRDFIREWVYGYDPVFDKLAKARLKIYTDRDECLKDAKNFILRGHD